MCAPAESEIGPREPLVSRIRARFAAIGLDENVPELRGEAARPASFEA